MHNSKWLFQAAIISAVTLAYSCAYFFQTSDSKNAFLGATHYDITIHDPPKEDDVPLAFQKVGKVLVNHVEGHLQFSLPLDPINDTLKNSERHYEEGKKRQSIGLQRYLPCIDEGFTADLTFVCFKAL